MKHDLAGGLKLNVMWIASYQYLNQQVLYIRRTTGCIRSQKLGASLILYVISITDTFYCFGVEVYPSPRI